METILGIDLGTTNSVVAVYRNGRTEVLRENGEELLPSVVGFDEQGGLLVGTPARNQLVLAPDRTVKSIKRRMGEEAKVRLGEREFAPQEVSAMILRRLKQRAESALGSQVAKAVITVPAFFSEVQREATREAGQLAGLEVVRIINEPTAAALAYDPQPDRRETLLVYDLGGGTFDVSVVQIEQGVVEVLASHGDTHLGGDDFDQALLDFVSQRFRDAHGVDPRESLVARSRVLRAVEEAKKRLSFEPVVTIEEEFLVEHQGKPLHLNVELRREDYEDLVEPWLLKTLVCVDEALSDAKLQAPQIDKVILVGGVTRTPLVQRLLSERLRKPLHLEVNPDLGVALGAAVQGAMIAGDDVGPVLVDITPHTLGIQAIGEIHGLETPHYFSPIILRNTALPATRSELYATSYDGQDRVKISVYQGEHDDVRHNRLVGEFMLEDLRDADRGNEVLVRFDLDLDGILKVAAVERATGRSRSLVVDNAVERLRCRGALPGIELPAEEVFLGSGTPVLEATSRPVAAEPSADSSELREATRLAEELIGKARQLASSANPSDAADLERSTEQLLNALADKSLADIRCRMAELEDLVFYLHDA